MWAARAHVRLGDLSSTDCQRGSTSLLFYSASELLQLRVLGLGFFQDGNIGIGVFPEREGVLAGMAGSPDESLGRSA